MPETPVTWATPFNDLDASKLKTILYQLSIGINNREIMLGKIPAGAGYGPWYDASVNSGGAVTDTETWTYWIGGDCDYLYNPEALTTTWYRNWGELGLGSICGPDDLTVAYFDHMPLHAVFDERDHWGYIKCEGDGGGTLGLQAQRECNPPLARQIDAMRAGIAGLMINSLSRGSTAGGHRAGATHYSAAFVFPCSGGEAIPGSSAGSTPCSHCLWMRKIFLGTDTPTCTQKKSWCGDCGKESSPYGARYAQRSDWVFCDEDCWAAWTNNNNYGMVQSASTRSYCYWTLPRLLSYVNYKNGAIPKNLPLGYDGRWWWETDLSWKALTSDGHTVKSDFYSQIVATWKIFNSMQGWFPYKNHSALDLRIWQQMKDCLNELYMIRYNYGMCEPGERLTVTGTKRYITAGSPQNVAMDIKTDSTMYDCDGTAYISESTGYGGNWHYLLDHISYGETHTSPSWGYVDHTWSGSSYTSNVEPSSYGWIDDESNSAGLEEPEHYSCGVASSYTYGDALTNKTVVDVSFTGIGDHIPVLLEMTSTCTSPPTLINRQWGEHCRKEPPCESIPEYVYMGTAAACPAGTLHEGVQNYYIWHAYMPSPDCYSTYRVYNQGGYCNPPNTWVTYPLECISFGTALPDVKWVWSGASIDVTMTDVGISGASPSVAQPLRWTPLSACPVEAQETACLCCAWAGLQSGDGAVSGGGFTTIPSTVKNGNLIHQGHMSGLFGDSWRTEIYPMSNPWCRIGELSGHVSATVPTNPDWFGESCWAVTDCRTEDLLVDYVDPPDQGE